MHETANKGAKSLKRTVRTIQTRYARTTANVTTMQRTYDVLSIICWPVPEDEQN